MMGRKRKDRKDLPERMYFSNGAYYFVTKQGKWEWLGRDLGASLARYGNFVSAPIPGRMSSIMDRYIENVSVKKSPRTLFNNRKEIVRLKTAFGHMEPHEIKPSHVSQYKHKRPPVAANREIALLSSVFKYAIDLGATESNPCKYVSRNTEKPRRRHVETQEYKTVYEIAPPVIQCAMELARQTGLRLGDLLKLNERENVREDGLYVETGKTGKRLLFAWTDSLRSTIDRCRGLRGVRHINRYLLANREGGKYTPDGFATLWQRLMVKSGIERFQFRDLRSMAADLSDNATELLGHNDPGITNKVYKRAPRRVTPNT